MAFDVEPAAERLSVRLGDRFEILANEPEGGFRSSGAEAYRAIDRHYPSEPCLALLCEPGVPPRMAMLEPLAALRDEALLKLLGWGVVDWPPRGRRCFALVFERPESRVVSSLADDFAPLAEDDILANLLPPAMAALKALFDSGYTHRAIRPTNLFYQGTGRQLLLGESHHH